MNYTLITLTASPPTVTSLTFRDAWRSEFVKRTAAAFADSKNTDVQLLINGLAPEEMDNNELAALASVSEEARALSQDIVDQKHFAATAAACLIKLRMIAIRLDRPYNVIAIDDAIARLEQVYLPDGTPR